MINRIHKTLSNGRGQTFSSDPLHLLILLFVLCCATNTALAAGNFQPTPGGAEYKDLKTGEGQIANIGDVATIHFIGWLDSNGNKGREFFNTRKQNKPASFVIGTDKVMPGWNEAVIGMQEGGKRLVKLPPQLGYGSKGVQNIVPPNARLIMIIELLELKK
jgi:FKBP-type peptidyl-prolyl cis-trans isomerase